LSPEHTKLEAETRKAIDAKLEAAGWVIQDKNRLNLFESLGVAVREMDTDTGPADYMLFINGEACGPFSLLSCQEEEGFECSGLLLFKTGKG
jgi:hypothetical protein